MNSFFCGVGLGKKKRKETITFHFIPFEVLEFFYHAKYVFPEYIFKNVSESFNFVTVL